MPLWHAYASSKFGMGILPSSHANNTIILDCFAVSTIGYANVVKLL